MTIWLSSQSGDKLVYIQQLFGPKTDPCGTPKWRSTSRDVLFATEGHFQTIENVIFEKTFYDFHMFIIILTNYMNVGSEWQKRWSVNRISYDKTTLLEFI